MLRTKDTKHPPKVTSFRCFGANWEDSNASQPPGGGTDTVELPNKPCAGGIRSNTNFPQHVYSPHSFQEVTVIYFLGAGMG